ncbi:MAG: glycosyltransferase [Proteobacteria bacterium]|nr:glycosyltransferase [Pseudomonadota bacterium]
MHILDLSMLYKPASGGVARHLAAKKHWLRSRPGIRHTLLTVGPAGRSGDGVVMLPGTKIPFAGPLSWPSHPKRWIDAIRHLEPDVIEISDIGPAAWYAFHAARTLGVPVLGFAHVDLVRFARERRGAWAEAVLKGYTRMVYERCDLVMTPSAFSQRRFESVGVPRVIVRPLGVDATLFQPGARDPSLRASLGLAPDTRLLVYAGRFAPEKRIDVLLAAFQRLGARYRLLLVGDGPVPALPDNVRRLPFVASPTALARLLASADALVHAGDVETFGLVYLEAMACGRPVVAAAGGAAPEIITSDCGELAAPGSPAAFATAIEALYARDLEAVGRAARRRVLDYYTLDHCMHRLLALYRTARAAPATSLPVLVAS